LESYSGCNVGLRLQGFGVFGIGTLQFRFRESFKERSMIPAHRRVDVTEEACQAAACGDQAHHATLVPNWGLYTAVRHQALIENRAIL
jgi:hypothetical protein